ncbi:MAG: hypothetical protein L0216_15355 [Planctomycetales bacterium]|nr:hypothetical protein [Planctomycetales bacterium]
MSRPTVWLGAVAGLLGLALVAGFVIHRATRPSAALGEFLGEEWLELLSTAETIESCRIGPPSETAPPKGVQYPDDFRILGRGPDLDATQRKALQGLLREPSHYLFDSAKACIFEPGIALTFRSGARSGVVLLCFHCDEWGFQRLGRDRYEDFDPVRPQLVALVKELFPNDPVIQGLKERR